MQLGRAYSAGCISVLQQLELEEVVCVGLLAFFAMQGAIPGIAPNQANEMTDRAATGLMKVGGIGSQILANGAICFLALRHLRRLRRFAFALQWTVALAALAVCSTLWSQDPMTTARRSIPFVLAMVFGLFFASRFQLQQQLKMLTATMVLVASASILLALFSPSIGLEASTGHFGNWQGVFTQKNACGRAMVFATAAILSLERLNPARMTCFSLFLFVLVMSGSRGAWIIESIVLLSYALIRFMERFASSSRMLLLSGAMAAGAMAGIAAWVYFPLLAELLGRDATLTGRTAIWQQVWIAILKHPLLGYGFAAFWQGMKGESYHVVVALRFVLFHAHNGFLEIWLELGAIGLLLFALSYLRAWKNLWRALRSQKAGNARWMFFSLLLVALYDVDENTLLAFNGLFWILYVAAIANIEIMARERQPEPYRKRNRMNESNSVPAHAMV